MPKQEPVTTQLLHERPPISPADLPAAESLLARHRARRRNMRLAFAAGAMLLAAASLSLAPLQQRPESQSVAESGAVANADPDSLSLAESTLVFEVGPSTEQGYLPILVSDSSDDTVATTPVGFFAPPPSAEQVPLWQLTPSMREDIYRSWEDAGFRETFEL